MSPFEILGICETNANEYSVLCAWRRLALEHHPDKGGDDVKMKEINAAKDACIRIIVARTCIADEHEFVLHIARLVEKRLERNMGMTIDLSCGALIQPFLRKHMWFRAVDAMEWVLHCAIGDAEFVQEVEDEIPILCRYYNTFLGEDEWSDQDHTFMTVLNRYDHIKAGGYGNFARRVGGVT